MSTTAQSSAQMVLGPVNVGGDILHLTNNNGTIVGWIDNNVTLQGSLLSGTSPISVAAGQTGTASSQGVSSDFTLGANAGKTGDTAFLAAVMGNLFNSGTLTKTGDYLAGLIGMYSVTGAGASTFPVGGILAGIGDGSTDADGAVVAFIDGDSSQTNANAAFKVMNNNSVPGSGFSYGIDLSGASHDGFPAVAFLLGEIRLSNGQEVYSGAATTRAAVLAQVGSQGAVGSFYLSSAGKAYLKVANAVVNTDWQLVTTTAAD